MDDASLGSTEDEAPTLPAGTPETRGGSAPSLPGILGPFRLIREIGVGGMGSVYLAVVQTALPGLEPDRQVAVKTVHPELLRRENFLRRFHREGELGRTVSHPGVVHTLHVGSAPSGDREVHYLAMEYVEGHTLRRLLRELGPLPEELCRHVGREVAEALTAIHAAGIVHRDLKPENVLITSSQHVKVMDLGVARVEVDEDGSQLTDTGAFVGSIRYAAPEQLEGAHDVDGRADLYSLGTLLFELLTGERPHGGSEFPALVHRILRERPERASTLRPDVSPFLDELVDRLLARVPEDRIQSAEEVRDILDAGETAPWWRERAAAPRGIPGARRRARTAAETSLHGREPELRTLHAAFADASAGIGHVVLIEGEAGIGKTRLVDEFLASLEAGGGDVNLLVGANPPGGAATAAGAFCTAYREHLGEERLERQLERYLAEIPLMVPAFAALLRGDDLPRGKQPLTRHSLQTVFVHVTRALAAERPTVVVIEDLHFAPPEGLALVAALAVAVPRHPVLLVTTTRRGLEAHWPAELERLGHAHKIVLPRLGSGEVRDLLAEALRAPVLVQDLAPDVYRRSEGNPFFVFEMLRSLRESGAITRGADGGWTGSGAEIRIRMPETVVDLVDARLSDLDARDRQVLECAACCGAVFDPDLPAEVLGLPRLLVLTRLAALAKSTRLVQPEGRWFRFDHQQVQETLLAALPDGLREEYHRGIGRALARAAAEGRGRPDVSVEICRHFLDAGGGEAVLEHLAAALDHLEGGCLNDDAARLAERALAAPGLLVGRRRIDLLLRRAGRLDLLGQTDAEHAVLTEAVERADELGAVALRAETRRALAGNLYRTAAYDDATTTLEQARDLFLEAGDPAGAADVTGNLGAVLAAQGRYRDAAPLLERQLATMRKIGREDRVAAASGNLGTVLLELGRYDESERHVRVMLDWARKAGLRHVEAMCRGNLGNVALRRGRFERARAHFQADLALAREIGHRHGEAVAFGNLGLTAYADGRLADADRFFREHLEAARETHDPQGASVARSNLGALLLTLGDVAAARQMLETAVADCRRIGNRRIEGNALRALGEAAEREGDPATAEARYREAADLAHAAGLRPALALALLSRGRLQATEGAAAEAAARLEEAVALGRRVASAEVIVLGMTGRAALPGGSADAAEAAMTEYGGRLGTPIALEARHLLHVVAGRAAHQDKAADLLETLLHGAPAARRPALVRNVPHHLAVALLSDRPLAREALRDADEDPTVAA